MNFVRRFAVICAALLLVSVAVSAQTTSSLTGTVTLDGNPLPGVTVTISSPALLGTRTAVSDVNGNYNFGAIPPGTYTVKFEMESMQSVTRTASVTLSGTGRANAEMKLTAIAEAITVTASAPAVLETTEIQSNIQQEMVNHLPIQRTLQGATALAPGVTTQSGTGGAAAGAIVISGAPSYDSVFMVNGAAINENLRGQAHNLFIEDAIQETTVLTGAISAEYGRFTGGVVNAITKSGGNEFSGSLRDSLSNDKWTSRGDLNTGVIGDKINHVYEATLGGYALKDRLWFFVAGRQAKVNFGRNLRDRDLTAFTFNQENKRYEGKLTGQITPKHSLVGSYLKVENPEANNCFGTSRCLEWSNIDLSRELPNNFLTIHYNGILTSSFLIEGSYAKKYFAFKGSGGDFADPANGSYVGAYGFGEGYAGAPIFCGFCDDEERNNDLWGAKGTYYLASKGFGTHNLVGGYEEWAEQRIANNYQSGSNFAFYSYGNQNTTGVGPARGWKNDCIAATPGDPTSVHCHPTFFPSSGAGEGDGDLIKWAPIFELTKGSDFKTQSIYFNDKWDFSDHWNFNVGVRYDKNDGADSSGEKVAKDSEISPRLGLIYDIKGNGRYRINASYSKYVSRVAETIGSAGAGGGNPSYVYYEYLGPVVNANHSLTTQQALAQVFSWFFANGGLKREFLFGNISGLSTKVRGSLKSPSVDEWTVGFGSQLTTNAYFRADVTHKEWNNFYTTEINTKTGQVNLSVTDPQAGKIDLGEVDFAEITNSDFFERTYDALTVQAAWRPWQRINVGGNYTLSELEGNVTTETSGSGPVTEAQDRYPEYRAFAQHNPVGALPGDQRHKLRAWITYDQPTPIGNLNISLLQRFDSGTPYSAVGTVDTRARAACTGCVANPGYETPPTNVNYYFSDRGAFRWDDITSTDLGVTFEVPVKRLRFFAQGKMVNVFNEQGVINGDTTVLTARQAACIQDGTTSTRCAVFNPFTETPVKGKNWQFGPNFGKPQSPTANGGLNLIAPNGHFQLPRTYLVSLGLRF